MSTKELAKAAIPAACKPFRELFRASIEGTIGRKAYSELQTHVSECAGCNRELALQRQMIEIMNQTFNEHSVSETFDAGTNRKILAMKGSAGVRPESSRGLEEPDQLLPDEFDRPDSIFARLGAAPWWAVSLVMHALVIVLAGLISMGLDLPKPEDALVTVTELTPAPIVQLEKKEQKPERHSAVPSKHDTPPTDPRSKAESDIVVPPDILERVELGDHFETINLDREDTHSAFGNPDAHMFHPVNGNEDAAGGGGTDGNSLEDMIGVGSAGSPGRGGGWGGGDGTGTGVDKGSGHGSFGQRGGGGRKLMVKRHGGSPKTEGAVNLGLDWLARHQEADGSWNALKTEATGACGVNSDPGITGLCLLAFLGAGHTEKVGQYQDNVRRAVAWIIKEQSPDGAIGHAGKWRSHHTFRSYNHAICGLALVEAAGMGRIAETKAAAQKAVDFTIKFQAGEGSDRLGWRYAEKCVEGDMSVTGWYVMQLKSAKVAGIQFDAMSLQGALEFMKSREEDPAKVQKVDEYDNGRFRYGYTEKGQLPNCTAIGVLCQLFCGTKPEECQGAASWLLKVQPPEYRKDLGPGVSGSFPYYYTYYTTLAMFQIGGEHWKKWNEGMKKMLVDNQRKDGDFKGSWDPMGVDTVPGRAYTTALASLSLEVYYRYAQLNSSGH
jgi:hypothetical protein